MYKLAQEEGRKRVTLKSVQAQTWRRCRELVVAAGRAVTEAPEQIRVSRTREMSSDPI